MPSIFEGSLRKAFRRFGGRADGLTEPGFYRLVRDARLRTQKLTSEQIGAIFDACKEKYTDMLLFETFFAKAVPLLASAADVDVQKTAKRLVDAEPRTSHGSHGTSGYTSVFDKLTDVNRCKQGQLCFSSFLLLLPPEGRSQMLAPLLPFPAPFPFSFPLPSCLDRHGDFSIVLGTLSFVSFQGKPNFALPGLLPPVSYTGMYRERFTSPNTSAAVLGSRRNSAPMDTYASYFETDNPA